MKGTEKIPTSILLLFGLVFVFPQPTLAVEGTCSSHLGVNCSVGPDWDGSSICNDGWTSSGERYFEQIECGQTLICTQSQWEQQSYTEGMSTDRSRFLALINQINTLNLEYPLIEIRIEQEYSGMGVTSSIVASKISGEQQRNRNNVATSTYAATLLDQKLRSAQLAINKTCATVAAAAARPTAESCMQSHGVKSILDGYVCSCQSGTMFNKAQQCMPASDVCRDAYGQGGIPIADSTCGCAYGYHVDLAQQQCVEDAKPVRYIPATVKKWVDDNYAYNTPCSSNTSFTEAELKVCSDYQIPSYRQKYDWQVEKPVVYAAPTISVPVVIPQTIAPQVVTPKVKEPSQKPKEIKKPTESIVATNTEAVELSTTVEHSLPTTDETKIELPPPTKPKTFWSRVISWFKFW